MTPPRPEADPEKIVPRVNSAWSLMARTSTAQPAFRRIDRTTIALGMEDSRPCLHLPAAAGPPQHRLVVLNRPAHRRQFDRPAAYKAVLTEYRCSEDAAWRPPAVPSIRGKFRTTTAWDTA